MEASGVATGPPSATAYTGAPSARDCRIASSVAFTIKSPFWSGEDRKRWASVTKSPVTATNLPLILYAGVAASLLAPFCWITGVRRIGAARASLFLNLLPVIVAVLAYFVLGEHLQVYHVVGGAVALIGVAIAL